MRPLHAPPPPIPTTSPAYLLLASLCSLTYPPTQCPCFPPHLAQRAYDVQQAAETGPDGRPPSSRLYDRLATTSFWVALVLAVVRLRRLKLDRETPVKLLHVSKASVRVPGRLPHPL